MNKEKVAFICVHNSCRSQIAEALAKKFGNENYTFFSAGTEKVSRINQDAVRLIKDMYSIDMEKTQFSKVLTDIPPVDIVVTMGCNVKCPYILCKSREDWELPDPTGESDEEFIKVIKEIETLVKERFE